MPESVREALERGRLMDAYRERPVYQRDDSGGWLMRAKLEATWQNRLKQMLHEVENGGVHMKMKWTPKQRQSGAR